MTRTVLITGTSSGIGRAAALAFQQAGWNVVATMRSPEKEAELGLLPNVLCTRLDVTRPDTIAEAIAVARSRFGGIDVVVNNAGYGLVGFFEGATPDQIQRQFETNVFGIMNVVRAILPHFRERGRGRIVNVASMGGRLTVPLYSVYHATKWAVEGFSESLRHELRRSGIDVKIVEPGAIRTDFYGRSADVARPARLSKEQQEFMETALANMNEAGERGASPEAVARVIVKAAEDGSRRLRYPVGPDARGLLFLRRVLSDTLYEKLVEAVVLRARRG